MAGHGPDRRAWSPAETVITPANVATVTAGWSATLTAPDTEPVSDANTVIQAGQGTIRALDRASGSQRWSVSGDAAMPPAIRNGTLISALGSTVCVLQTRALATGVLGPSATFGGFTVPPGSISMCSPGGAIVTIGDTILFTHTTAALGTGVHCGGTGWEFATDVVAVNGNLIPEWSHEETQGACGLPDFSTLIGYSETATDGTRAFVVRGSTLSAFALSCASPCAPSWSVDVGQPIVGAPIVLANGDVAVGDKAGTLSARHAATGAADWSSTSEPGAANTSTSPAATDASVFMTGPDGTVRSYAAAGCGSPTCSPTWTAPIGATPAQRASIGGGVLYVPASGNGLVTFDARGCGAATCSALKTIVAAHPITGPPAIVGGRVIVPTRSDIETFALPTT